MQIELPEKLEPLFRPKRFKILFGGRGGMKTESLCRVAAYKAYKDAWWFMCLRQHQNSIEDSVHAALSEIIHSIGASSYFDIQATKINCIRGGGFRYGQMTSNLNSIKSKFRFNAAWIEEGDDVTQEAFEVLEPTIRADDSELWGSFNPVKEDGYLYQRFCLPNMREILERGIYEDDELLVIKTSLDDNPWAPQVLKDASERMKREDYDLWLHIYGGEPRRDLEDVIIQPKWVEAAIDAHKRLGFQPVGVKSLAFDPADDGSDAKGVAMRHGSVMTFVHEWKDGDIEDAINRAWDYVYDLKANCFVWDADGIGAAVKVGLAKRTEGRSIVSTAYHGGAAPDFPEAMYMSDRSNKDTFKNKRAQYWWKLRDRFEATYNAVEKGVYTDPDTLISLDSSGIKNMQLLKAELTAPRRKRTDNSRIQVESKPEMASRGVKSPNMADAVVMAFANQSPMVQQFAMPRPIRPMGRR